MTRSAGESAGGRSVSVIIPFYNGAQTIRRAIASIEAQTVLPAEIVVVDDGSPTPLPPLESTLPLVIVRHERNRGIPGARNTGIRASSGEWIGFLDQDDQWEARKLERQLAVVEREGPRAVVFGRLLHTGQGARPRTWPPLAAVPLLEAGGDAAMRALVRYGNAAPFVTLLVHRTSFDRDGYLDETLRGGGDDYEFIMHRVAIGAPLRYDGAHAADHSAVHHFTGSNYSAHAPRWLRDNVVLVNRLAAKYPLVERHRTASLADTWYTWGRHHDRAGNVRRARAYYARSVKLRPGWLRPRAAQVWLVLPHRLRRFIEQLRERVRPKG